MPASQPPERAAALTERAWPFVARSEELDLLTGAIAAGAAAPGRPAGAVVVGATGVGKTRLLAHARAWAQEQGYPVHTAIGTRAGAQTPYGALAHLAPATWAVHAGVEARYRAFAAALRSHDGPRPVLVVDDAHLLDAGSAALVLHLAMTGTVSVLVSVRRGEPVADPITALWKDGLALRVDLQNFSREETEALIRQVLGGDVDAHTLRLLAHASGGNALYTRELVRGTLAAGALRRDGDTWTWDGSVVLAPQLVDVIGQRLADLSAAEADGLGSVALGEPLALNIAEALIGTDVLARLENAQLVRIAADGARLGHPLYGDVTLARLGTIATRRLMRALADAMQEHGSGTDEELMRIATWRLDAGGEVAAGPLARAAVLANQAFDHALAERLARAAVQRGAGPEAQLALARALNRQRRFEEAETLLAGVELIVQERHDDLPLHRGYLSERFFALFEGLGRDGPTAAMLDRFAAAHEGVDAEHRVAALRAVATHRAKLALDRGALHESIDALAEILRADEVEPVTLMDALQTAAEATAYLGNTDDARALMARLAELAATGRPELAAAAPMGALQEMLYQVLEGRVADLLPAATGFYEQLIASRDDLVRGLAALAVGATQLLRGTAESARRALTDAVHAFGTAQIADHLPWALALRCQAEALTGNAEAARRTQAASRSRRVRRGTARAHCDFVLADALTQLAAGDRTGAARTCVEGAAELPQLRLHAARLLHTAVRLGAPPGPLAARLTQIADLVQCPLPRLQAEHAAALAAHDAAALDEIAERFERLGLWLVAAESAAQASACHAAAGHKQAATRAAGRSADLAGRCEGARTPALALVAPAARLSRREREVAELAAAGLANAQIAQRLTLSTRTVESHLYQAYAKLGVAGRDDLAAALAAPP